MRRPRLPRGLRAPLGEPSEEGELADGRGGVSGLPGEEGCSSWSAELGGDGAAEGAGEGQHECPQRRNPRCAEAKVDSGRTGQF